MGVSEELVGTVVGEISSQMADPMYGQLAVGGFLERHPDVGRYMSAKARTFPSEQDVIHAIFHAHVLEECFRRHRERESRPVGFAELDAASVDEPLEALSASEPALASYIVSNVEHGELHETLALVALALGRA